MDCSKYSEAPGAVWYPIGQKLQLFIRMIKMVHWK